jgi:hypothetical protein
MNTPVNRTLRAFVWLALVVAGCGHDVGDDCKTSIDCDPNGTRSCDLSQPGGYCTIAGCDETSCPSGSTCVRTFPPSAYLTRTCDPKCEDLCAATNSPDASADSPDASTAPSKKRENKCFADEICLDIGYCVKQSYEQRECARVCASNSDCRGGYECRKTGDKGSMALAKNPLATTSFCAPYVP